MIQLSITVIRIARIISQSEGREMPISRDRKCQVSRRSGFGSKMMYVLKKTIEISQFGSKISFVDGK